MEEVNEFLKHWQPVWQFVFYLVFVGFFGGVRLINQIWNRRVQERQAEKQGINPKEAERGVTTG